MPPRKTDDPAALQRKVARRDREIKRLHHRLMNGDRRMEVLLNDLRDSVKERDQLRFELEAGRERESNGRMWAQIQRQQIEALHEYADALAQKYAGVKLDVQQFNFATAQEWLKAERDNLIAKLNRVVEGASRNQCQQQRDQLQREAA